MARMFRWKDYAHGGKQRKMTLSAHEFLRRFVQHILPRGFVPIRQFGYLTNTRRAASLAVLVNSSTPTRNPLRSLSIGKFRYSRLALPPLQQRDAYRPKSVRLRTGVPVRHSRHLIRPWSILRPNHVLLCAAVFVCSSAIQSASAPN
jgi:hypothetical protein